ncbi:MAG: Wzz/FepE/Etk N-terminal domain-containing protein [Chthoniobacterales bacterium]
MNSALTPAILRPQSPPRPSLVQPSPGVTRNDFLFAIFRHKKMIVLLTLIGLLAAAAVYFLYPSLYQSNAKLLVRYVLDRSAIDSIDGTTASTTSSKAIDAIIGAEIEIIRSWDLAVQVAEAIGPKRLLPKSGIAPSKEAAAAVVSGGLGVAGTKGSNIIYISYKSSDPELAPLVLNELLSRYFIKHLDVHRSAGAFDFVSQQTDQVRSRLDQTEDALKALRAKVGIVSLKDGMTTISEELAKTQEQLHNAEADLAEQRARLQEMHLPLPVITYTPAEGAAPANQTQEGGKPSSPPAPAPASTPTDSVIQQYRLVVSQLAQLRESRLELLKKYTPGSVMVQVAQTQIDDLENQRKAMEKKNPDLPSRLENANSGKPGDVGFESARFAGLEARTRELRSRLSAVQARMNKLTDLAPEIGDLERKKEMEETNYKYFANTLEKARVDEALDPSKIPNISPVQRPSPPALLTETRDKIALGLAVGGLALGIVLALLRDMILSHAIRRPSQLETQLQTSILLSVPDMAANGHHRLPGEDSGKGSALAIKRNHLAPWDAGHFIRRYSEAIRDRIGLYFELHNLTHKPKLVGVTSFSSGAGTSTLAAGLAAALSETDDGKVLLVDVNLGPGDVHPFFKGKPAYTLASALEAPKSMDSAADNLYLATVGNSQAGPAQLGLKKFFDMMPNLKASDFDYIIFDMPPLTSTSQTWGMAAFMDKLLLVVEAEKNNRDLVKRGYSRLMAERQNVSVVLNKTRSYIPKSLDNEI